MSRPGRAKREYPLDVVERVRTMYRAGSTVREIAADIGPGYRAQTLVERFVSERRVAAKRDQSGPRNCMWRGDKADYKALHLRVQAARGCPSECSRCGATSSDRRYEWANQTGRYEDVADYERMCVPCHRPLDAERRRVTGRPTIPAHLRASGGRT